MSQPLPVLEHAEQARATVTSTSAAILQKIKDMADAAGCTTETVSIGGTLSQVGIKFTDADVADLRVVFFANASTQSVTMLTPDTETANRLMVGISKGVTVESMSSCASGGNPYGSTTFSGFWQCSSITTSLTRIWMLFSAESLLLNLDTNSGVSITLAHVGATIDPHSEDSGNCEASGRIYGMAVSGVNTFAGTFWNNTSSQGFWYHSTGAGQSHAGCWQPRTTTWVPLRRTIAAVALGMTPVSTDFRAPDGKSVGRPIYLESTSTPPVQYGRLRDVFYWHDANHAATVNRNISGVTTVAGYTMGSTIAAATDAAFFAARDNRSPN